MLAFGHRSAVPPDDRATVRGDVAQLEEHRVRIAGVRGSSPLISTTTRSCLAEAVRLRRPAAGMTIGHLTREGRQPDHVSVRLDSDIWARAASYEFLDPRWTASVERADVPQLFGDCPWLTDVHSDTFIVDPRPVLDTAFWLDPPTAWLALDDLRYENPAYRPGPERRPARASDAAPASAAPPRYRRSTHPRRPDLLGRRFQPPYVPCIRL